VRPARRFGFSLVELLLVAAMFSLFMIASYTLLSSGVSVWQRTASSQDAGFQMGKARVSLQEDLRQASFASTRVGRSANLVGGATEGNVVWLLSALNPASQTFCRKTTDGLPFYQRNIVYYLAVPRDHDSLFGVSCAGTDTRCPHKFLIRRVFDSGPPTAPDSPLSKEEKLLGPGQVQDLIPLPRGYSLELTGADSESDKLVATGLLDMSVSLGSGDSAASREVRVTLSGFDVEDAGKKVRLGQQDLKDSSYTHTIVFSVFPGN
jgi:hypothetical protein